MLSAQAYGQGTCSNPGGEGGAEGCGGCKGTKRLKLGGGLTSGFFFCEKAVFRIRKDPKTGLITRIQIRITLSQKHLFLFKDLLNVSSSLLKFMKKCMFLGLGRIRIRIILTTIRTTEKRYSYIALCPKSAKLRMKNQRV